MGLWKKIKKAVKKVAEAVEDFVNDVGDAIGNAVETVGDAINDALNWVGDKIGGKPIFSWLGGVIKGIFSIAGAIIKGVFGIVGGILSGIIKIVGGILTLQGWVILDGIWDIFSPIIGTIIVVVGKVIAWVQSVFYLQGFERPLTKEEIATLKKVFKKSLNYYVIRIVEGHAGIFGINSRPFTLGNTMYMKTSSIGNDLLVHEVVHVWQYQQDGNRYASDALGAQFFVDDEYNWRKEVNERGKTAWVQFNNEAQAEFFEDLWDYGGVKDASGTVISSDNGAFFDADNDTSFGYFEMGTEDYTDIAIEAVKVVRNEWF